MLGRPSIGHGPRLPQITGLGFSIKIIPGQAEIHDSIYKQAVAFGRRAEELPA